MKYCTQIISIMLLFLISCLSAQDNSDQHSFGIFGGLATPTGDFGDDDEYDNGSAETGFALGIEYNKPMDSPGLSWYSSVTFMLNSLEEDVIEDMAEDISFYLDNNDVKSVDAGYWINIPVMTGIKYYSKTSPSMAIFITGQLGVNFIFPPASEATITGDFWNWETGEYEEVSETVSIDWDMGTSFGFAIGGGLIFNDNIILTLRYYTLGEPELEGKIKSELYEEYNDDNKYEWEGSISIFSITVGINL